jgi:hypothetical protein
LFCILAAACLLVSTSATAQDAKKAVPPPRYQFCSGTVIELSADRITVRRGLPGRVTEDRRFSLTAQTKVEGELKMDSRVTVGFVQENDGDVARRILVRAVPPR